MLLLRACILAAALIFLVRGLHWNDLANAAKGVGLLLPTLVLALNACVMSIKAARLRLLLRQRAVSFSRCFITLLTTAAINNVTPFRGGDVARLWMLERAGGITKSAALAIGAIESLVDITVLAAIGLFASLGLSGQGWVTVAAPIVFVAASAVLILLRMTARRAANAAPAAVPTLGSGGFLAQLGRRLRGVLERLEPGCLVLSRPSLAARAVLLTLLSWTFEIAMVMVCARAMGIAVGPVLATVVLFGINLALALPLTPASAGPFESAAAAVLVLAGVAKGPAVAFAILYHAVQVIPVTLLGGAILFILKRKRRVA